MRVSPKIMSAIPRRDRATLAGITCVPYIDSTVPRMNVAEPSTLNGLRLMAFSVLIARAKRAQLPCRRCLW